MDDTHTVLRKCFDGGLSEPCATSASFDRLPWSCLELSVRWSSGLNMDVSLRLRANYSGAHL